MKLPELVETKLRDGEAIVLPRVTPVKKGQMTICYHCDGKAMAKPSFLTIPQPMPIGYGRWHTSLIMPALTQ